MTNGEDHPQLRSEVCKMLPSGEVVCNEALSDDASDKSIQELRDDIQVFVNELAPAGEGASGGASASSVVDTEYAKLARAILKVLVLAKLGKPDNTPPVPPLDGTRLPYRRDEIVGAVEQLLDPNDLPSLLAFKFSTQPGDVFGAYHLNKGNLVWMRSVLEMFKQPKPGKP